MQKGHIVSRGHWGKVIRNRPLEHSLASREFIYEDVRLKSYSHRPSRFESVFLCPNLESAGIFGERNRKDATLYSVEIVDTDAKWFIGNWNMMAPKTASLQDVETCAHDYWKGIDVPNKLQEYIVESDVRILGKETTDN